MPWTVQYSQTTEKPAVGTLRADYADGQGIAISVVTDQLDTNDSEAVASFMNICELELAEQTKLIGDAAVIAQKIEAQLNS